MLKQLDMWKDPARMLELCQILVFDRPGEQDFDWPEFYCKLPEAHRQVHLITATPMDISATELRRNIAAGRDLKRQIPDSVARYIQDQGFYQTD